MKNVCTLNIQFFLFIYRDLRLSIIEQNYWTAVDKQYFLSCVSREMLIGFIKEMKSVMFVEGLIQGNVTVQVTRITLLNY